MWRRDGGNAGTRRVIAWALMSSIILLAAAFALTMPGSGAAEQRPKAPGDHLLYYPFVPRNLAPPHLLAGLTYAIQYRGLWNIDWAGQADFLTDIDSARLSPNGRYLVYGVYVVGQPGEYDVWMEDLQTSDRKNLTNTPERIEKLPEWIPNRPGLVLFGSEEKTEFPSGSTGMPTTVSIDGSNYQVVDENGELAHDAIRVNGSQIAYNAFGFTQGGIHTFGKGVEYLDPVDYGLEADRLWHPAWSADGRYLAWETSLAEGLPYSDIGIVIYDLKNKTAWSLMYPYASLRVGHLTWSPDQEWLTFVIRNIEIDEPWMIWALHARDRTLTRIGNFDDNRGQPGAIWRYDGKYLAYNGLEEVIVVEAGTWKEVATLPAGSTPVDWFYPAK